MGGGYLASSLYIYFSHNWWYREGVHVAGGGATSYLRTEHGKNNMLLSGDLLINSVTAVL